MGDRARKLRTVVRRDGVVGVARTVAARGTRRLFLREDHVWYSLALDVERPRRDLPDGFDLRLAGAADAEAIAHLPNQPGVDLVRARIAGESDVYLVRQDQTPAFACTIFHERAPVLAAPGGWLDLPDDTVVLEDSGTSPAFRGRGVAPGAWSAIADALRDDGYLTMLTKVTVDNEASRRAVTKAGFREAVEMRLRRTGARTTVEFTPLGAPGVDFIGSRLSR